MASPPQKPAPEAKSSKKGRKLRRWLRLPEPAAHQPPNRADAEAVLCVNGTAFLGNVVVKVL